MIVVSDTTPIISLLKAGHLELLRDLYGKVLIPKAVYRELTENPAYAEESKIISGLKYLEVVSVGNLESLRILRAVSGLDVGESEALIMYGEQHADLLIMDERKGRNVAKRLNIRHIGTAGILMLAFDRNFISSAEVKRCLDIMLANHIRLGKKICRIVLEHVGLDVEN